MLISTRWYRAACYQPAMRCRQLCCAGPVALLHSAPIGNWTWPCRRADGCRGALARQEGIRWTTRPGTPVPSTLNVIGRKQAAFRAGVAGRTMATRIARAPNGSSDGETIYAALDLGTNNCRLLVARPAGDGFHVIDAFSRIIRLGEGISASGRISEGCDRAARGRGACRLPRQDEESQGRGAHA